MGNLLPKALAVAALTALGQILRLVGGTSVYATVRTGGVGRIVVFRGLDARAQVECRVRGGAWACTDIGEGG